MKIILVRHGETEENKAGILMGDLPGVLSDLGKRQAEKLAERLKNEKIDLMISSDMDRAFDTAKAIAGFHPGVDLITDERLRERGIGDFQGKSVDSIDWENLPESVETNEEIENRVFELFGETLKKHPNKNILFAAHAGTNRALIRRIHEGGFDDFLDWKKQGNTCVNIFNVDEFGKVRTRLLNCTGHLE